MKVFLLALIAVSGAAAIEISPAIRVEIASGRFAEARRLCLEVTARDGSDVDHWLCAAQMSAWLGDYATAVSGYDTVLALSVGNPEAMLGKSRVLIWQYQLDQAQVLLEKVQSLAEGAPSADVELAFAQLERARGRTREARVHAARAVTLDAANKEARSMLDSLEVWTPVTIQFGETRELYSFFSPGLLSSMAATYQVDKSAVSFLFEAGYRFGERTTRGGAGYSVRLGKRWAVHGQAMVGPAGDVFPTLDLKAGATAKLGGQWVAGIDYRSLNFEGAGVQILSPSIEYYWRRYPIWAQASMSGSRTAYKEQAGAGELATYWAQVNGQIKRRLLAHGGVATGDENYDNLILGQIGRIHEKLVFGGIDYRMTHRYTIGLSYGFAERSNNLTQQIWGVKFVVGL